MDGHDTTKTATAPRNVSEAHNASRPEGGATTRPLISRLIDIVACAAFAFCLILSLDGALANPAPALLSGGVAAVAAIAMLTTANSRTRLLAPALLLLLGAVLIAGNLASFQRGGLGWVNGYISSWNVLTDSYEPLFGVTASLLDLSVVGAVLGLAVGGITGSAWRRRSILELGLLGALFLIGGLLFQTTGPLASAALLLTWLLAWTRCGESSRIDAAVFFQTALMIALGLAVSFALVGGFSGSNALTVAKYQAMNAIDTMRFGEDPLPEGDLNASRSLLGGEEDVDRLKVTFAAAEDVQPLYMRGFTGGSYEDGLWTDLPREDYEGEWGGLFAWMQGNKVDPLSQFASYADIDVWENDSSFITTTVQVETLGACRRFAFLPYNCKGQAIISGDTTTVDTLDRFRYVAGLTGSASYSFEMLVNPVSPELASPASWVYAEDPSDPQTSLFTQTERAYHRFVYEHYLAVDDTVRKDVDEFFFDDAWNAEETHDLYTTATRIRTLLAATCTYEEHPSSAPGGVDYLSWFLTDSHTGNSAAFSSSAVMAFRAAGIPARYNEGYLISTKDARSYLENGVSQITLTDRNAHAWVEVYVDGMGWMPIEVTPGFYDQIRNTDDVIEVPEQTTGGGSNQQTTGTYNPVETDNPTTLGEDNLPAPWLLILAMLIVLAALAYSIAELQRVIRLDKLERILEHGNSELFARTEFDRLRTAMTDGGVQLDWSRPLEGLDALSTGYPFCSPSEHALKLEIVQRVIFGGSAITARDRIALDGYVRKLEAANRESAGILPRLKFRYAHLYR